MSNPEARIRGAVVQGDVAEIALEGRAYTPFTDGFGVMFGVPMAFHLGQSVRFDTGVYVPILFHDPTEAFVSLPFHLWIQATNELWLGPLWACASTATQVVESTFRSGSDWAFSSRARSISRRGCCSKMSPTAPLEIGASVRASKSGSNS